MKPKLIATVLITLLLVIAADVFAQMGYRRDPWGGSGWTGPGAPPHWSPEGQHRYNSMTQYGGHHRNRHMGYNRHYPRYPHYRPCYPAYPYCQSYLRGSSISIYTGPGGWYISSMDTWGWHDRRRRGFVYYSQPIYGSSYQIIEEGVSYRRNESQRTREWSTGKRYGPKRPEEYRCSRPPRIKRNLDGSSYLYFEKLPIECLDN